VSQLDNIEFEFTMINGDVINVKLNRAALAEHLARKMRRPGKGGKRRERLTRMEGAVTATRRRIQL
jgi:hypothetical protein